MEREAYGKNLNWAEHPFLKNVFWIHGQENTQKCMLIPSRINVFIFPRVFIFIHGELSCSETFLCVYPSRFSCFFIVHVQEIRFGAME